MNKWLEVSMEEDRYGNCISAEEKVDIYIDVKEEDNYILPVYKDNHYITNTNTYFYEGIHCQHNIFYYKTIELVYNEKNDLIRETTKNVDGKITKEVLCDYKFDEFGNKIYEAVRTKIDNEYQEENEIVYTYDNKYNESGQLIENTKAVKDGEAIFIKKYKYENNRLDKIETYDINNILYETSEFYYDNSDSHEEKILSFGELSYYNQYTLLEDKRYRKTMLNPVKGKYKWSLNAKNMGMGIVNINIFEPILIADVVIEILEYLTESYKDKVESVIIKKHDSINIDIFKEDLERLYQVYYDKYKLEIKYF